MTASNVALTAAQPLVIVSGLFTYLSSVFF